MEPTLEGRSKGFSRLETGNLWHRDIEKEPEQTGQDNDPSHTEQATEYTKDTPHRGMTLGMIKSSRIAAMIKVSTVRATRRMGYTTQLFKVRAVSCLRCLRTK